MVVNGLNNGHTLAFGDSHDRWGQEWGGVVQMHHLDVPLAN